MQQFCIVVLTHLNISKFPWSRRSLELCIWIIRQKRLILQSSHEEFHDRMQKWWNGRHEGLKILWPLPAVWVRVPLSVLINYLRNRIHDGSVFYHPPQSDSMAQNLKMEQRIGMRLSQQQLKFVKLLELNAPELDEAVERELEDNPALGVADDVHEEEEPRYLYFPTSGNASDPIPFAPPDESESLYDYLNRQLSERKLPEKIEKAARYIIGSLDSNGYLHRSLANLINDMAFGPGIEISPEEGEEALKVVRSLEPAGIGATDLRDCLEMQLEAMPQSEERDDALRIMREAYEPFTMKHKHRIISLLRIPPQRIDRALALILTLNPKPGSSLGHDASHEANVIVPDFIVNNEDGEITITLNNKIPELRIEQSFDTAMANLARTAKGRPKKGSEFIVSRYNDARDFIRILSQRQQTMMAVMTAIVNIQKEYFLTEDVYKLKPMMIKNVAELTGLDLSVISRATANKFVATPWGNFPLRFFFSDSIGEQADDGSAATNRKIEAEIALLVEQEDKRHPLSDQKIMEEMATRGYDVSRRTVAKYRDRQGIPVARLRKTL